MKMSKISSIRNTTNGLEILCIRCKKWKSIEEFRRFKLSRIGYERVCSDCKRLNRQLSRVYRTTKSRKLILKEIEYLQGQGHDAFMIGSMLGMDKREIEKFLKEIKSKKAKVKSEA